MQGSRPSPSDEQGKKVLTYVSHTAFFEYLRNHYVSFAQLAKPELLALLKSAELLRVCEERSMVISFNQPTICVVIYGEIVAEEKAYPIGKFFIVGQVRLELSFKEKSLLVMLHQQSVQTEMQAFEDYYFKKKLIEKLLPVDLLRLTKKQTKQIVDLCEFRTSFAEEKVVKPGGSEFGLYLLLDGTFSILSKEEVKIGEINLEYFGEEILWQKEYDFYLSAESVQCRLIFLNREVFMTILTPENIKAFNIIYNKRSQSRLQLQKKLCENIRYTRDFMNRMNLTKKASCINPEYKTPLTSFQKRINKQLHFQNVKISDKINSTISFVSRKTTPITETSPERFKTQFDDSILSQEINFQIFEPKLYRDQKAKTEHMFRRRVKSEVAQKTSKSDLNKQRITDREAENLKNLPKTLSVLLKYYESTEKLRPRPKSVNMQLQRGFVPCSKERRIMTTMKLHKEIFMREYFEIKALEDKAFKTWR